MVDSPWGKQLLPLIESRYPDYYKWNYGPEHTTWVSVDKIVGTAGPNARRFFEDWTPTPEGRDPRWNYVWESFNRIGYNPENRHSHIHLIHIRGEYWVVADGNRRVAAAHMLHIPRIKADVVEMFPNTRSPLYAGRP